MRKFLILALFVCMMIPCSYAETAGLVFHYPFGITDTASSDDIKSTIESVFGKKMEHSALTEKEFVIVPENKELFGTPVSLVYYLPPDNMGWHYINIVLDSEAMNAEKLLNIYKELTSAYGSPEIAYAKSEEIDLLSGKKMIEIPIENTEAIQHAMDLYNLNCVLAWGNICIECTSSSYEYMGTTRYSKRTNIFYALTEEALKYEVKQYYELNKRPTE